MTKVLNDVIFHIDVMPMIFECVGKIRVYCLLRVRWNSLSYQKLTHGRKNSYLGRDKVKQITSVFLGIFKYRTQKAIENGDNTNCLPLSNTQ